MVIKMLLLLFDSLAKSLVFTNLYAAGNRTVRGLEAVTYAFLLLQAKVL
jgi:hypothetical protein